MLENLCDSKVFFEKKHAYDINRHSKNMYAENIKVTVPYFRIQKIASAAFSIVACYFLYPKTIFAVSLSVGSAIATLGAMTLALGILSVYTDDNPLFFFSHSERNIAAYNTRS